MSRLLGVTKLACLCSGPTHPGSLQVGSVLDPGPQPILHPIHGPFELRAVGPRHQRCHSAPAWWGKPHRAVPLQVAWAQSAAPSSVQGLAPEHLSTWSLTGNWKVPSSRAQPHRDSL